MYGWFKESDRITRSTKLSNNSMMTSGSLKNLYTTELISFFNSMKNKTQKYWKCLVSHKIYL